MGQQVGSRVHPLRAVLAVFVLAASSLLVVTPAAGSSVTTGPDALSVDRLYQAYFLRAPDAGGLAYWNGLRSSGTSLGAISHEFSQSAEFRARYGHLSHEQFVELVYRNVMDRAPDAGGFAHWTGVLNDGRAGRGGVMLGFSDSAEFKVRTGLVESPVESAVPEGSYHFMARHSDGSPVRWNPCQVVDVVVNFDHAPTFARDTLPAALRQMSVATGTEWRLHGETTEWVSATRAGSRYPYDLERYGERWAPLLVNWDPDLNPAAAGVGGPTRVPTPAGSSLFITGQVVLRPDGVRTPEGLTILLMHELGHAYGLAHATVPGNIMYSGWTSRSWGVGDLEGFRRLREGGCIDVPTPDEVGRLLGIRR